MLEAIIRSWKKAVLGAGLSMGLYACNCGSDTFGGGKPTDGQAEPDLNVYALACMDEDNDSYYAGSNCGTEIDCDDKNNRTFPGAIEFCDYLDNNCNGEIDEGVQETFYADRDEDGFGNQKEPLFSCLNPKGDPKDIDVPYADNGNDCNDNNSQLNPKIAEICDGVDNNCNKIIDDGGDALCNDSFYCNGEETCRGVLGCLSGINIDCSENNIEEISRCNYIPDSISGTWDSRPAFTSSCEETTGAYRCTIGDYSISHACDIVQCGAECEIDDDCPTTDCDQLNDCYEGTYRDYRDMSNTCQVDCLCTVNACTDYIEISTDEDDDGYDVECDNDCDDIRLDINPGIEEIIDGIDNDCDGITDPNRWLQVSAGLYHTCGIRLEGTTTCWGYNNYGQSDAPEGETYIQVSAGDYHSCGLREDGTVNCWGLNDRGQASPLEGRFTQISAGASATCGLREDGSITCWGAALSPPEGTFVQVSVGGYLAYCALKTDNEVICRGLGMPVPSGTYIQVSTGGVSANSSHACGIRDDNSVVCWGRNSEGQANPPEESFIQISAGGYHTCGLKSDNTVACWGYWSGGGTAPSGTFTEIDAGGNHNCGLKEDNTLFCWGRDLEGQLDPPEE